MHRKYLLLSFLWWIALHQTSDAEKPSFTPPSETARARAMGSLRGLPTSLRTAFTPGSDFEPIDAPGSSDWLANQREPGQTYEQYRRSRPNRPSKARNTIYVLPIGDFSKAKTKILDEMSVFGQAFFGMKIEVLRREPIKDRFTTRINDATGNEQVLTLDILNELKGRVPKKAYCLIGLTMTDLYPNPKWNFVFGQASLRDRVGVYSFARYDPQFPRVDPDREVDAKFLTRCLKVFAHETCHMYGMAHCIYFNCLMNGSNHLGESDSRPLHLCPVCLRKLHAAAKFDPEKRYEKLLDYCRDASIKEETDWLKRRLAKFTPSRRK